jgi:pantoate kinase
MLLAVSGLGVVEIPWVVGEFVYRVGVSSIATEVAEIVGFGVIVRRFVGGLVVRIRSSVPTHADAL